MFKQCNGFAKQKKWRVNQGFGREEGGEGVDMNPWGKVETIGVEGLTILVWYGQLLNLSILGINWKVITWWSELGISLAHISIHLCKIHESLKVAYLYICYYVVYILCNFLIKLNIIFSNILSIEASVNTVIEA